MNHYQLEWEKKNQVKIEDVDFEIVKVNHKQWKNRNGFINSFLKETQTNESIENDEYYLYIELQYFTHIDQKSLNDFSIETIYYDSHKIKKGNFSIHHAIDEKRMGFLFCGLKPFITEITQKKLSCLIQTNSKKNSFERAEVMIEAHKYEHSESAEKVTNLFNNFPDSLEKGIKNIIKEIDPKEKLKEWGILNEDSTLAIIKEEISTLKETEDKILKQMNKVRKLHREASNFIIEDKTEAAYEAIKQKVLKEKKLIKNIGRTFDIKERINQNLYKLDIPNIKNSNEETKNILENLMDGTFLTMEKLFQDITNSQNPFHRPEKQEAESPKKSKKKELKEEVEKQIVLLKIETGKFNS